MIKKSFFLLLSLIFILAACGEEKKAKMGKSTLQLIPGEANAVFSVNVEKAAKIEQLKALKVLPMIIDIETKLGIQLFKDIQSVTVGVSHNLAKYAQDFNLNEKTKLVAIAKLKYDTNKIKTLLKQQNFEGEGNELISEKGTVILGPNQIIFTTPLWVSKVKTLMDSNGKGSVTESLDIGPLALESEEKMPTVSFIFRNFVKNMINELSKENPMAGMLAGIYKNALSFGLHLDVDDQAVKVALNVLNNSESSADKFAKTMSTMLENKLFSAMLKGFIEDLDISSSGNKATIAFSMNLAKLGPIFSKFK